MAISYRFFTFLRLIVSVLCLLNIVLAQPAPHGWDKSVCDPATFTNSPTPKKPVLPNTYSVKTECNFHDKSLTTDISEYYDNVNNVAAVTQEEYGLHELNIFSYNTNELLTIEDQFGTCTVSKLSSSDSNFLFGFKTNSANPKAGQMFSAYGALRFGGNFSEQYMGQTVVRGMRVDHWRSCQYIANMDATTLVDWYFTVPGWATAYNTVVPVRCTVTGNVWDIRNNVRYSRPINHTYELAEFTSGLPSVRSSVFETPSGYICKGRKDTKPVPTPSNYFRFTSEILNPSLKTIGFIKEWYDFKANLVRYDYKPNPLSINPYGMDLLSEVHDWTEGVAYVMDPALGNCTAVPISSTDFDAHALDPVHVRIRTPQEFFYFDRTNYAYEGIKKTRGVDCDVWIAHRTDWPPGSPINSTWEWYFAVDDWVQSTGHTYDFGMPVQMRLKTDQMGSFIYNIYDYDEEHPSIFDFDISKCFNFTEKRDFSFKLNARYKDTVGKNVQIFKYMVLLAVHKYSNLSPLRIQNIKIDYDATHVFVTFTALGGAPIAGSITNPAAQIDLSSAADNLNKAINGGTFQVLIDSTSLAQSKPLTATPYTLSTTRVRNVPEYYVAPPSSKTTYSAGSLVGLGVAMLVIFFIIGFVGVYLYFRNKNPAGQSTNTGKSSLENPAYENTESSS